MSMNDFTPQSLDEQWLPVVGYEKLYEVSNVGRVRRIGGGILKPFKTGELMTYYSVGLSMNGVVRKCYVHRLVASAFIGTIDGLEVNHIDGNGFNNLLSNLELVTRQENIDHAVKHRLLPHGEAHPFSKLKEVDIYAIHDLYETGHNLKSIQSRYKLSQSHLMQILAGDRWSYLGLSKKQGTRAGALIDLDRLMNVWQCVSITSSHGTTNVQLSRTLNISETSTRRALRRLLEMGCVYHRNDKTWIAITPPSEELIAKWYTSHKNTK